MIKATKTISTTILGIALTAILFSIALPVLPSSVVQAQEMGTNTTSPANESVIIVGNTTLPSQLAAANTSITTISIVKGGADPNNEQFYVPKLANITVGATVKWINDDPIPHTVTSGTPEGPTKEFDSGFMKAADSFIHTFNEKGLFEYFCLPHPWMTGTVAVS
jgi:nitrite reductase (NO-forming)